MSPSLDTGVAGVEVRYRPLGDVLLVDVPTLDSAPTWIESPDADIDIRCTSVSGQAVVSAVRVVHARSRWQSDRSSIPLGPHLHLDHIFAQAERVGADSLAARARVVITGHVRLPLSMLSRAHLAPPRSDHIDGTDDVVRALSLVADAIESATALSTSHDAVRTVRLVSAVRELADAVRRHRRQAAPGATIAALRLVCGRLPLTTSERIGLRAALERSLDTDLWPRVACDLSDLAEKIAPWLRRRPIDQLA